MCTFLKIFTIFKELNGNGIHNSHHGKKKGVKFEKMG